MRGMRVFLFEFVSGGGWWKVDPMGRPPGALLREGKTMLAALASDFVAIDGCEVIYLQDRRLRNKVVVPRAEVVLIEEPVDLFRALEQQARECDYGVIIAPEFNQHLYDWCAKWRLLGGKLLGPSADFIRIASSKCATAEHLAKAGIRVPSGVGLGWPEPLPEDFPLPAVLKPDDGVGSQGILYVAEPEDGAIRRRMNTPEWRLEEYRPGMPVSVGLLSGPRGAVALPACLQWLAKDGTFSYRGGMVPLDPALNDRAQRLARAVASAMPPAEGYFGVDMVLGDAVDGSEDFVIEVNPRLTTSYVGLRAIAKSNLAEAMLNVASGEECDLSFDSRRVQFTPDGQVVALS